MRRSTSWIESLEARRLLAFSLNVNFQPPGTPTVAGYAVDSGAAFGDRGKSLTFGWDSANLNTRDRNAAISPSQLYDTLDHLQKNGASHRWEVALPNGSYSVRIVAGDPSFWDSIYKISAEGTLVVSGTPSSAKRWFDGSAIVNVADGRLTISNAPGSKNNKIDFIQIKSVDPLLLKVNVAIAFAGTQLRASIAELGTPTHYANNTKPDGSWNIVDARHWTSGFWPGSFWRMDDLTGDAFWKDKAAAWSTVLATQPIKTEDITFRFYLPFGPVYKATHDPGVLSTLVSAVSVKMNQYNATVGAFKTSWRPSSSGNPQANYGVLLDNIADADLVYYLAKETGNTSWSDKMTRHIQTLIQYFIRPDGSTLQWGYFNSATGQFVSAETYQGSNSSSAWSRGQAWAMNGLTIGYRETGRVDFLAAARKVSDYFLSHLPADGIPYWDFASPDIPATYRDTSAAAIAASSLLQFSKLLPPGADADRYRAGATKILNGLLSPAYLAQGTPLHSLLQHGASSVPLTTFAPLADSGLICGDYFLLEALKLYKSL